MTETVDPPTKLTLRPTMGLQYVKPDALPWLQVTACSKRGTVLSNVKVKLTALCLTPQGHEIIYLECCATSTSVAHAIMAAATEQDGTNWAYCPTKDHGFNIHPMVNMRVADTRLQLKGHAGLHHFALMAPEDTWILADGMETLWRKLRKRMSCPTKPEWSALLPKMMEAGALLECERFGLPDAISVYVLELDADATFDRLCADYVKEHGL